MVRMLIAVGHHRASIARRLIVGGVPWANTGRSEHLVDMRAQHICRIVRQIALVGSTSFIANVPCVVWNHSEIVPCWAFGAYPRRWGSQNREQG
jgi:hypothetical protein